MSKPEATSAKSLEEIIASIRKSLAGQGAGAGGRGSASRPERVEPELALPADEPPKAADPVDTLFADRLAGALNGANGATVDDDLSDILAQDDRAAAAPKPVAAAPAIGEDKPPELPWRIDRGAAKPVASESVELSRPEELRRSLPPLFGEGTESPPLSTAAPPLPQPMQGPSRHSGKPFAARTPPQLPAAEEPSAEGADLSGKASDGSAAPVAPADALPVATPVASEEAAVASGPALGPAVAVAPAAPAALPDGPDDEIKAAPALSSRALEQVIAGLLEPVIRHWLDSNLPRLIEKVVREEVVKAIAAERAAPKA